VTATTKVGSDEFPKASPAVCTIGYIVAALAITFQNYRGFSIENPVTLEIDDGITFLLGVNNVGKSSLIRAFYELRPFIDQPLLNNSQGNE
jgi:ABC-type siderophore export system fused ATPase/permease subunit